MKKEAQKRLVEFDWSPDESLVDEDQTQSPVRKSARERRPPDHYGEWVTLADSEVRELETAKEAMTGPDRAKWREAMKKEMESLIKNNFWDLTELPRDGKPVCSK